MRGSGRFKGLRSKPFLGPRDPALPQHLGPAPTEQTDPPATHFLTSFSTYSLR